MDSCFFSQAKELRKVSLSHALADLWSAQNAHLPPPPVPLPLRSLKKTDQNVISLFFGEKLAKSPPPLPCHLYIESCGCPCFEKPTFINIRVNEEFGRLCITQYVMSRHDLEKMFECDKTQFKTEKKSPCPEKRSCTDLKIK